MPENLLCMQLSHIRYANMDFFKTPHIQIQLLGKDPVFKYEFLVLFIYPWGGKISFKVQKMCVKETS